MKILMVAMPNHHFFQWVNQLKETGYEVYWFDVTDGGSNVKRIDWVHQIKGWKLRYDYPLRHFIKSKFPRIYEIIQTHNERKIPAIFTKLINKIQPDIVHCFEMRLAGFPILEVMEQNPNLKFVYSSWGSDIYFYKELGVQDEQFKRFLERVDYLITDCDRDFKIAQKLGFTNNFLGVFPGNGGVTIETSYIQSVSNRKTICIKGYDDGVGKALLVLKAIESLQLDNSLDFLIFSADDKVVSYIKKSDYFKLKIVEIISRNSFLSNKLLLQKFGSCLVYLGNSTSDGIPNSLLEAMGMGAFPIQSNPGNVTEEIITNSINGYLIQNPDDVCEIANHIINALKNETLLEKSKKYNTKLIGGNYNRNQLKDKVVSLYKTIAQAN
jgi:glycosyltransferase involved in cell wall biosynthesis